MIEYSEFTYIALSNGRGFSKIDLEDSERVNSFKKRWYKYGRYVACWHNDKNITLHRFIMNAPIGLDVDHKNGDGLDNRKENLRIATRSQNSFNSKPKRNRPFKGVHFVESHKRWRAKICINYKQIYLGEFKKLEDALRAYDNASKSMHGEYSLTNQELIN